MITYELAKKLKDAGFPQELTKQSGLTHWNSEWSCEFSAISQQDLLDKGFIKVPTLSELIGVCGDGTCLMDRGKDWQEYDYPNKYLATNSSVPGHYKGFGLTHEEAVANLWLSLNS